jgi:nitrogen regulatory protein P-II 1
MIVRSSALDAVQQALRSAGVKGVSVSRVKGYGEYKDLYSRDPMTEHVRLEVFTHRLHAAQIVDAVCSAASTGGKGDGVIAVLPVENVYRIRDHAAADPHNPAEV